MFIKDLLERDDAVSPVIGVILMVAITVILAAVIASFVLNLGDQAQQQTPTASFDFEYDNESSGVDKLTITHASGDTIDGANLNATVSGGYGDDGSNTGSIEVDDSLFNGEITAGSSSQLNGSSVIVSGHNDAGTVLNLNNATVRIIYTAESGGSSSTITTWEGPNA
ncbi:type IV pilin [Halomicrobium salinisoli]|uniref:type IV pilin n=1 Tax=Halomicrobium salinisoli TaxID=2878391 RepID=UPI001CF09BFE|nr:type IV pilin N-terminal domain-containing protein [Halomicrobium salinisoli]